MNCPRCGAKLKVVDVGVRGELGFECPQCWFAAGLRAYLRLKHGEPEATKSVLILATSYLESAGFLVTHEDSRLVVRHNRSQIRTVKASNIKPGPVAIIEVKADEKGPLVAIEQMVFGDRRPKFDELMRSLQKIRAQDVRILKTHLRSN